MIPWWWIGPLMMMMNDPFWVFVVFLSSLQCLYAFLKTFDEAFLRTAFQFPNFTRQPSLMTRNERNWLIVRQRDVPWSFATQFVWIFMRNLGLTKRRQLLLLTCCFKVSLSSQKNCLYHDNYALTRFIYVNYYDVCKLTHCSWQITLSCCRTLACYC